MDGKIDIYCEYRFLEKFYTSWPQTICRNTPENLKHWVDFDELLCKHSKIVVIDMDDNMLEEQIDKTENLILKEALCDIRKKWIEGDIEYRSTVKKIMEDCIRDDVGADYFGDKAQSLFLLDISSDDCKKMEEDYGLIFVSSDSFDNDNFDEKTKFLFSPNIELINETTENWDFVRKYQHPCNYIFLVDNFLYRAPYKSKDTKTIEKNIETLFNALLPERLNKNTFNVYIYTTKANDGKDEENQGLIKKIIKDLRKKQDENDNKKGYDINVQIDDKHIMTSNNHDRYLLTNYCIFQCGYGFVLNNSEKKKGTSLMVWPSTFISYEKENISRNKVYKIMQYLQKK